GSAVIRGAPIVLSCPWKAADPAGQLRVRGGPRCTRRSCGLPRVEGRALDFDELTQPLHLGGVLVVGDELEAAHQFVSPAKYLAAERRISRSVVSLAFSASSCATRACSRAAFW